MVMTEKLLIHSRLDNIWCAYLERKFERKRMKYDLVTMYRILLAIKESPRGSLNLTELVKAARMSASTIEKYVEVLKKYGLIEEKTNRERRFYLTTKGNDFLFLFGRVLALLGEAI